MLSLNEEMKRRCIVEVKRENSQSFSLGNLSRFPNESLLKFVVLLQLSIL